MLSPETRLIPGRQGGLALYHPCHPETTLGDHVCLALSEAACTLDLKELHGRVRALVPLTLRELTEVLKKDHRFQQMPPNGWGFSQAAWEQLVSVHEYCFPERYPEVWSGVESA